MRLPKDLDPIVLKALAKNADERFQTAGELRAALEQYLLTNQLPSSSVQLATYMKDIYKERLMKEAEEGRVLLEEIDSTRDPFVRTPLGNKPVKATGAAEKPAPPIPEDVTKADRSSSMSRERDRDRERPTATISERERQTGRTESMSMTEQDKAAVRFPWVLTVLLAILGAGTGAFLFLRATQGATVNVTSDPASAAVTFDGKVLDAVTPCALPKTFAGVHSIALTKRGYGRLETTVNVPPRGEVDLPPFKLEKEKE
jgi:hypothetical protein